MVPGRRKQSPHGERDCSNVGIATLYNVVYHLMVSSGPGQMASLREQLEAVLAASSVRVKEEGRTQFFQVDEQGRRRRYLKGITKRLHDVFYPRQTFGGYKKRRRLKLGGGSSAKKGTRVHAGVRHAVNCRKRACSCPGDSKRDSTFTPSLEADFRALGLTSILAECPAWSEEVNVMTLCDVVAETADGGLALIELKTGYSGSIDETDASDNRYLSKPFRGSKYRVENSVRQRHYLQANMSAYLFNKSYYRKIKSRGRSVGITEAWVVYLGTVQHPKCVQKDRTVNSWFAAHDAPWAQDKAFVKQVHDHLAE